VAITVDAASVHRYVAAVGDTNPAYPRSPDDAEGKVAPPTFAAVYALGAGSGSLSRAGIAPNRLIHGEQSFEWRRAVRVGERLTAQGRIADVYSKRQLQFVVAETVVTDESGEEVCRSRATILVLPDPAAAPPS
jgi:acyl dehydratase